MSGEIVRFVCVSTEHSRRGHDQAGGVLTINDGQWAYCPWGQADNHSWDAVDGIDLAAARTSRFSLGAIVRRE